MRVRGTETHGAEVGAEALGGGLDGGNLVGAARAGRAAEGGGAAGAGDLAAVGLDLGDGDGALSVGRDVDDLVVGEARVLARVEVDKVTLVVSGRSSITGRISASVKRRCARGWTGRNGLDFEHRRLD